MILLSQLQTDLLSRGKKADLIRQVKTMAWRVSKCRNEQLDKMRNGSLCGSLFFYKPGKLNAVQLRVTQHKANFSAKHKRDLATKGFAFGNHSLLKKAGENFTLLKLGPAR